MSATMFKAVVWKELRENLKWAVFVLLGMAAVLAFAIPSLDDLLRGQGVDLNGLFNALDATTTIGSLLAGLMIGAAQTLVENRGDKWGFLAHRPIERTTLFWGKATAGILLYAISTGLPVAAALARIASPGYLPIPFDWGIALPAAASFLGGLVFYFAGLLTGMRQARWYASRALGIGAAVCCLILQVGVATAFWQAVAACAVGLIIVGTAAWSTFVAGGQYGAQPRIGRVATGVSIGLGLTLVGWVVSTVGLARLEVFDVAETLPNSAYTSYGITSDGVVVRMTGIVNRIVEVSDPDGRPLKQYQNDPQGQPLGAYVVSATLSSALQAPPSFRSTGRLFTLLRRASGGNPISWYYVHRLGLLAAYDTRSRRLAGWLGPDGFSPADAKPRRFPGRLKSTRSSYGDPLLVLEDAVYRVNLDERRVEKVFERGTEEAVLDAGGASPTFNAAARESLGRTAEFEVISTTRRVIVQLRDGTKLLEVPQRANAAAYPVLRVARAMRAPGIPTFLWYETNFGSESHISEFNSAGTLVNSWSLPATNHVLPGSWPRMFISAAITPLIGQASLELARPALQDGSRFSRPHAPASWVVAVISSFICAAAVFLHGRRYAFAPGRLFAWTTIALLLGPLGYLLMLALIEWPARESCTACSRKRVVTRQHCEHCGAAFAAPPHDGTEIFEPAR